MIRYLANIPGVCMPMECFGANEQEARKHLRRRLAVTRLSKGTKLYPQVAK